MPQLDGPTQMIISKQGPGRLYYRLGLRYAPLSLQLPALERGFTVQRTYEATEDNRDVVHDVTVAGTSRPEPALK